MPGVRKRGLPQRLPKRPQAIERLLRVLARKALGGAPLRQAVRTVQAIAAAAEAYGVQKPPNHVQPRRSFFAHALKSSTTKLC